MADSDNIKDSASTIQELVGKLREVQLGLQRNLANLQQALNQFYSDPDLCGSIEIFRSEAESRVSSLEEEVRQLSEELRAAKELLDSEEKEN